jgi:CheY-specific phosphatase CheX
MDWEDIPKDKNVSDMHNAVLKPFIDETVISLKSMAGLEAKPGDAFEDFLSFFEFKGIAIGCETSGNLTGHILIHHYTETALKIGQEVYKSLLGEEIESDEIQHDIEEALMEWANTLIGLATRKLRENNFGIEFRPPFFIHDTSHLDTVLEDIKQIITLPIQVHNVGRFYFNLLLKEKISC